MNDQLELPMPARTRVRLQPGDMPAERTPWQLANNPPMPGWWEVKDIATEEMQESRWWWDGLCWKVPLPLRREDRLTFTMTPAQFDLRYAWRGLKEPSPDIYPCPPYKSNELMFEAKLADVTVRTMFTVYTRSQRTRNRL